MDGTAPSVIQAYNQFAARPEAESAAPLLRSFVEIDAR